jgi:methionine aminopeptidase
VYFVIRTLRSSDPLSAQTLAKGDVVKLHIGAQIDGFAAISAETMVVGATAKDPVTGRQADVLKAAWHAAEIAMRLVKVGNKNWLITDAVGKVAANWGCKPVEGNENLFDIREKILIAKSYNRHAFLRAETKCHRREKTNHLESQRRPEA